MEQESFPFNPPALIRVDSVVETCGTCGAWLNRCPIWDYELVDCRCHVCGGSSVRTRLGRPYSRRSRHWNDIQQRFNAVFQFIDPDIRENVVTDPPMSVLPWGEMREWYEKHNMFGVVTVWDEDDDGDYLDSDDHIVDVGNMVDDKNGGA